MSKQEIDKLLETKDEREKLLAELLVTIDPQERIRILNKIFSLTIIIED